MPNSVIIRTASPDDAERILKIYEYYVKSTAVSFEYTVPTIEEFRKRIADTLKKYPYLVAECGGELAGYAYAGCFNEREAYYKSAELSIYLEKSAQRQGIGRRLYLALEHHLSEMGVLNLYACIAYTETDDEYLTKDSVLFHQHMGFEIVGKFHKCGYKFSRPYSMVWMEKIIGEHTPRS